MHPELSLKLAETKHNWLKKKCREDEAYLWLHDDPVLPKYKMVKVKWSPAVIHAFASHIFNALMP